MGAAMSRKFFRALLFCLSCVAATLFSSSVFAQTAYGISSTGQLVRFDVTSPGTINRSINITGLAAGETIVAIDFRPATGHLFGLSSLSRLYIIDTVTGAATAVGTAGAFTLNGTSFGFDFNPTVDRIRVVSDTDQNLRLNPTDGTLSATDTPLAYVIGDTGQGFNPRVVGSAYTNNFSGAVTTTLYGIDVDRDVLVIQNPANAGTLTTVGGLNVDATAVLGFDIVSAGGVDVAYAVLQVGTVSGLYRINLALGAATLIGNLPAGITVTGLAIDPNPPRLANISTRGIVLTGQDVLIGGFIIGGSTPKTVMVRASGPSLSSAGVTGVLQNPQLQLFSGQTQIAFNDNWGSAANATEIQGSGLAPSNSLEPAILITLGPGAYTAIVTGVGGSTGIATVEVFEIDADSMPLVNISTRGQVLTGPNVLIGGFIIDGSGPRTVVVRARGPSLAAFGVTGVLQNPQLQLFSGQTQIAYNDNWQDTNPDAILASGFAPSNALESAIRITLPPGAYTAIVTGVGGGTGIGTVEVFISN
jgi:hypothetical protein